MGGGGIKSAIGALATAAVGRRDTELIVVCGSNSQLYSELEARQLPNTTLLGFTDDMAGYMRACDLFVTKPGGLSSTEAAVMGIPLIHIAPIPGCEIRNMEYFSQKGMSLGVDTHWSQMEDALVQLAQPISAKTMQVRQRQYINPRATEEICDLAEKAANMETSPGQG